MLGIKSKIYVVTLNNGSVVKIPGNNLFKEFVDYVKSKGLKILSVDTYWKYQKL